MIQLGKVQTLQVLRTASIGVYLGEGADPLAVFARKTSANSASMSETPDLLLPKNEIKKPLSVGESVRVFVYKDSEDRPIATLREPLLRLGTIATLTVKDVTNIGAFLDWGLPKDLLLPFREQTAEVKAGDKVLVTLYIDKSKRLCATMKLYKHLRTDSEYQTSDWAYGTVYELSDNFGAFVAVDNVFSGLISKKELTKPLQVGERVHVRILRVHDDGKLELSLREPSYLQLDADCEAIYNALTAAGGFLPYHDKSSTEEIKAKFHMSKNSFKRAIGHLMKQRLLIITDTGIEAVK